MAHSHVDHGVWARAVAADPFWASANEPKLAGTPGVVMAPMRLRNQPGTHVQFIERPFQLTAAQVRLLRQHPDTYELQLQCLLIDDPVLARLHWPFLVRKWVSFPPSVPHSLIHLLPPSPPSIVKLPVVQSFSFSGDSI